MSYAIISLGGKQHRVRQGERLLVDRVPYAEGKTFHPAILFAGGDGQAELVPKGIEVTARVVRHTLGEKIRIGKYRPKTGYRRHNGFRSRLSEIQIEAIRQKGAKAAAKPKAEAAGEEAPKAAARTKAAAQPATATVKPAATKSKDEAKPPAKKPAARKTEKG